VVARYAAADHDGMDATFTPEPFWRAALRPLITSRGWTAVTHHLLGLPLGVVYFVWFVTGLATGLGLAITLVGIPLLTLVLAGVRPLLAAERALANSLLDTDIPAAPLAPREDGWLGRSKAYWTDEPTWRGMAYLLARFPAGLLAFTVVVCAFSTAGYLIAAPIVAPFGGMELGIWEPGTWYEGLALVPVGLVTLVAAGWLSEAVAVMSRELARWGAR
jgi:hypothetical protein